MPDPHVLAAALSALIERRNADGSYVFTEQQVDRYLPYLLHPLNPSKKALTKSLQILLEDHRLRRTPVSPSIPFPSDLLAAVAALLREQFAPGTPLGNVVGEALGIAAASSREQAPPGPLAHHAGPRRKKV